MFAGQRPQNLGVKQGKLTPCPGTPNCVCSQSTAAGSKIDPLPAIAIPKLRKIIESMERTRIIKATDDYLYAEFTSKLMGFVDDVEFYSDRTAKVTHVRSASRLGKSDLGANRQRIEAIRAQIKG